MPNWKIAVIVATSTLVVACGGQAEGEHDQPDNDNDGTNTNVVDNDDNNDPANNDSGNEDPGNNDSVPETLSENYPHDEGIADDPAVVWHEDFEQDSIDELADRYDQTRTDGMSFSSDPPPLSSGSQSVMMAAGGDDYGSATDLYTRLPDPEVGYDQLYLRYYFRHHEDSNYHHTRANLGGYNPPTAWPQGGAGARPDGDDRLSVTVEPLTDGPERRKDFYNYWMNMRSWEEGNPPDGSAYGNTLIHDTSFVATDGQWHCLEVMGRLNDDPDSAAGGELAVWLDDELIQQFDEDGPLGFWIRDSFCPAGADSSTCVDYAPPEDELEQEIVNLQMRNDPDLALNYLMIQNYVTSGTGVVEYDDLVVATERIGCQVSE